MTKKYFSLFLFWGFFLPAAAQYDLMIGRSADEIVRYAMNKASEVQLVSSVPESPNNAIELHIHFLQPDTFVFASYYLLNSQCIGTVLIIKFREDSTASDSLHVYSFLNDFSKCTSDKIRMDKITEAFPIYAFFYERRPACAVKIYDKSKGVSTWAVGSIFYPDWGHLIGLIYSRLDKIEKYDPVKMTDDE